MFIKPKKSLGQNFLIDGNIIDKILNIVDIQKKDVLEIGPGTGNLTSAILKKNPNRLLVVEKDHNLVKKLKDKYSNNKLIKICNADILKFDIEKILNKNSDIIGNLPYNSHIIKYLALQKIKKTKIICMQTGGNSYYYDFRRSLDKKLSNIYLSWTKNRDSKKLKSI